MKWVHPALAVAALGAVAGGCGGDLGDRPGLSGRTTLPAPVTTTIAARPPTTTVAVHDQLVLGEGGLGRVRFGDDAEPAVGWLVGVLGAVDDDSGWQPPTGWLAGCPGEQVRLVRWGWLAVLLSDRTVHAMGRPHVAAWRYGPLVAEDALYPDGLSMGSGVALGTTLGQLREAFPGAVTLADGAPPVAFSVGQSFGGVLEGRDDHSAVVGLEAGTWCRPPEQAG